MRVVAVRLLAVAILMMAAWGAEILPAVAQETLPDYRRPDYGPRGVGTADWVFVPNMPSVYQRPRPNYDSLGITLGSFILDSQLGFGLGYNDNVFASDSGKTGDGFGILSPALRLQSDWSNHMVGLETNGMFQHYLDETSEDRDQGRATAYGRLDITSIDTLFGSLGFERGTEGRSDPENQDDGVADFNRPTARLGYAHQFARVNVRVNGGAEKVDYVQDDNKDRDRVEWNVGTRVTYALAPRFTPFIQGGYTETNFDDRVDDTGVDRDATQVNAAIGGRVLITEILLGEFAVGVSHTDFEDPSLDSSTIPTVSGQLTWNVTPLTSIIADAFRRESVSTLSGSSARVDTGGGLRIEHELLENLLVYGSADYRNEKFDDANRTDDRFRAGLGSEFLINRNFSLTADYEYENRNSNESEFDFTRNVVVIGGRLQY